MPSALRGGKNSKETGRVFIRMSLIFKLGIQSPSADLLRRWSFFVGEVPVEDNSQSLVLMENVNEENIYVIGNTVIDALLKVKNQIENDSLLQRELKEKFAFLDSSKKLLLVTGHRRESFGAGMESICKSLLSLLIGIRIENPIG